MRRLLRWLRRNERGQEVIEFAFSALLMLTIAAGIVDFGGAFQNYIIVTNAAREGARMASRAPCMPANASQKAAFRNRIVAAALGEAASSNVTLAAGSITISPDPTGSGCPNPGAPITVSVAHSYDLAFAGLIGMPSMTLRASTQMVFFGNDQSGELPVARVAERPFAPFAEDPT